MCVCVCVCEWVYVLWCMCGWMCVCFVVCFYVCVLALVDRRPGPMPSTQVVLPPVSCKSPPYYSTLSHKHFDFRENLGI